MLKSCFITSIAGNLLSYSHPLHAFEKNPKYFFPFSYGCYNTVVILMLYASQNLENKQIKQKKKKRDPTKRLEKSYPSLITLPF